MVTLHHIAATILHQVWIKHARNFPLAKTFASIFCIRCCKLHQFPALIVAHSLQNSQCTVVVGMTSIWGWKHWKIGSCSVALCVRRKLEEKFVSHSVITRANGLKLAEHARKVQFFTVHGASFVLKQLSKMPILHMKIVLPVWMSSHKKSVSWLNIVFMCASLHFWVFLDVQKIACACCLDHN